MRRCHHEYERKDYEPIWRWSGKTSRESSSCLGERGSFALLTSSKNNILQDEFIFRMYSIALIAITAAAIAKGDMNDGFIFMLQPGTYAEQQSNVPLDERSWSTTGKISVMIVS
jgi:hypothetical protein